MNYCINLLWLLSNYSFGHKWMQTHKQLEYKNKSKNAFKNHYRRKLLGLNKVSRGLKSLNKISMNKTKVSLKKSKDCFLQHNSDGNTCLNLFAGQLRDKPFSGFVDIFDVLPDVGNRSSFGRIVPLQSRIDTHLCCWSWRLKLSWVVLPADFSSIELLSVWMSMFQRKTCKNTCMPLVCVLRHFSDLFFF